MNITKKRGDSLDRMRDERLPEIDWTVYIYRENGTWGDRECDGGNSETHKFEEEDLITRK
jgi:hypothetical protein